MVRRAKANVFGDCARHAGHVEKSGFVVGEMGGLGFKEGCQNV